MHKFDQFKQDMEKMSKAKLTNPIKSEQPKSERSYLDATELNRPELLKKLQGDGMAHLTNLYQFDEAQTIPNCTVITLDGLDGFMWIGPDGVRHNEGLRWPTMRIEQGCTVEVLTDEYGRESKGWSKDGQQDTV